MERVRYSMPELGPNYMVEEITTAMQDKMFKDQVIFDAIRSSVLESATEWMSRNLTPEQVFTRQRLKDWVRESGILDEL